MTARGRLISIFVLIALFLGGCKAGIRTEITVSADGSAEIAFVIRVDADADRNLRELTGKGFAESYLLSDVAAAGWEVDRDTQGSSVAVSRSFAAPTDAGRSVDLLMAPLLRDVYLSRTDKAARVDFEFEAVADLSPAVLTDSLAAAIGSDAAAVLERRFSFDPRRDLMMEVSLRMPGAVGRNDADRMEGGALIWEIEGGDLRSLSARTEYWEWPYLVVSVGGMAAFVLLAVLLIRDLRGRSRDGDGGHTDPTDHPALPREAGDPAVPPDTSSPAVPPDARAPAVPPDAVGP